MGNGYAGITDEVYLRYLSRADDWQEVFIEEELPPFELAPASDWIHCTYQESLMYCLCYSYNGHSDWRLPVPKYRDMNTGEPLPDTQHLHDEEDLIWSLIIGYTSSVRQHCQFWTQYDWKLSERTKYLAIPVRTL